MHAAAVHTAWCVRMGLGGAWAAAAPTFSSLPVAAQHVVLALRSSNMLNDER